MTNMSYFFFDKEKEEIWSNYSKNDYNESRLCMRN